MKTSEKRKRRRKEEAGARKGRKVAIYCVFPRLAKAAGAEPSVQMRDEKVYVFVARSTFPSQNVYILTWK